MCMCWLLGDDMYKDLGVIPFTRGFLGFYNVYSHQIKSIIL
jgi:hypothetical protein